MQPTPTKSEQEAPVVETEVEGYDEYMQHLIEIQEGSDEELDE